jgi:uncharacterized protein
VSKGRAENGRPHERLYFAQGMHCRACEVLVEGRLRAMPGVVSARASAVSGQVTVRHSGHAPGAAQLTAAFADDGYVFADAPFARPGASALGWPAVLGIAAVLILAFVGLNRLGLAGRLSLDGGSPLAGLFVLGLLAGFSTCAALVGGIVLSLSKGWAAHGASPWRAPLAFNAGRLASFTVLGALLGAIGSQVRVSPLVTAALAIAVSLAMVVTALGMLGVRLALPRLRLPGRLSAGEAGDGGRAPFVVGALTFLLPCGFTFTAQGLAVLSGSAVRGGLTMLAFALGTLPGLLLIGFTGVRLWGDRARAAAFSRVAALLVLFFALYTVNAQLNVLGLPSLTDLGRRPVAAAAAVPTRVAPALAAIMPTVQATVYPAEQSAVTPAEGLAPLEDGVQVLRMSADASGYAPNAFRVRAGVPVRWEITDTGTSGCTNAVIARSFFSGAVELHHGQTSVVEFTPEQAGRYKFSCWMGMVSGYVDVVSVG